MRYSIGSGSPVTYYYITNLQGDVTALIDSSKKVVAAYEYDPYGKILTVQGLVNGSLKDVSNDPNHVANANPLRYRGYYYDSETGFYYLQSRYYDPAVCRFINADSVTSTGQEFSGFNMFVYCNNDPVNYIDSEGNASIWYYLIEYLGVGTIHALVQAEILAHSDGSIYTEVQLYRDGKNIGRADLMRKTDGAVWEIKHAANKPEARMLEALIQARKYIGGESPRLETSVSWFGEKGAFYGHFTVNCFSSTYAIIYRTPCDGVVLYWVNEVAYDPNANHDLTPAIIKKQEEKSNTSEKAASPSIPTNTGGIAAFFPLTIPIGFGFGGARRCDNIACWAY